MLLHEPAFWFCRCTLAQRLPIIISHLNMPTCGSCIMHSWFDFSWWLQWQKGRRVFLKEELSLMLVSNMIHAAKRFQSPPQLLSFLSKRLVKHYTNGILKVDVNRLCSFPKAAEQLLSGEWCCTSSWEEGGYFKPATILGFCSWWVGAGSCPWKGKQRVLHTLASHAAGATQLLLGLMGHDGASALRHLHPASHPPIQPALAGKRATRTPSPEVIHLTLGQVAVPCPVEKNLCKLAAFRSSGGECNKVYTAVVWSSGFPSCISLGKEINLSRIIVGNSFSSESYLQ